MVTEGPDSPAANAEGRGVQATLSRLVERFARDNKLSDRERWVVCLSAQGRSTKEICVALGCEVSTINVYWHRIKLKTRCESRLEVLAAVIQRAIGPGCV